MRSVQYSGIQSSALTVHGALDYTEENKALRARLEPPDVQRMLGWGFAQAVLSAIWMVEDTGSIEPTNPSLALAETIRPMLATLG